MTFREMRTHRWGNSALFPAPNRGSGSLVFGDFRRPWAEDGNGSENEAPFAAIWAYKEGRPDWRRAGRDPPGSPGKRGPAIEE